MQCKIIFINWKNDDICSQLGKHFSQLESAPRSKVVHDAAPLINQSNISHKQKTNSDRQTGGALFCSRWNLKPDTQVTTFETGFNARFKSTALLNRWHIKTRTPPRRNLRLHLSNRTLDLVPHTSQHEGIPAKNHSCLACAQLEHF